MNNNVYDRVNSSPVFQQLIRKRNRFALMLSAIMLIVYYSFVLFASTEPKQFAEPIAEGSYWAVGLLAGWAVQAFAFVLTGIYVSRANSDFDAMTKDVVEEALR